MCLSIFYCITFGSNSTKNLKAQCFIANSTTFYREGTKCNNWRHKKCVSSCFGLGIVGGSVHRSSPIPIVKIVFI